MVAGLNAKLNMETLKRSNFNGGSSAVSLKTRASSGVATATRSTSIGRPSSYSVPTFGVSAQRSKVGTGQHLNAKQFYSNSNYSFVQSMNHGVHFSNNNWGMPMVHGHNHNNGTNTFNSIMAGMALLNGLASIGAQIKDAIGTSGPSTPNITDLTQAYNFTGDFSLTGNLHSAKNFNDINNVEKNVNQKLDSLKDENYKKLGTDAKTAIDEQLKGPNVNDGLEAAGIKPDDINKLPDLSSLKIDENDLSSFDNAARTIDKDIKNVENFKNTLTTNIAKVDTAIEKNTQTITALQSDLNKAKADLSTCPQNTPLYSTLKTRIQTLENQIAEANKKQEQLKAAQTALQNINTSCDGLIKELGTKKSELGDIKQVKSEIADKKYELAQSQDKQIGNNNKKLAKLQKKIDKETDPAKKQALINEYNQLAGENKTLVDSLNAAGVTEFKNSKGKSYQLKNLSGAITDPLTSTQ